MACECRFDDGAYVLGALSPAERARYERHLADCAACRAAVAEVVALPGLLGRLDAAMLDTVLAEASDPSWKATSRRSAPGTDEATSADGAAPVGGAAPTDRTTPVDGAAPLATGQPGAGRLPVPHSAGGKRRPHGPERRIRYLAGLAAVACLTLLVGVIPALLPGRSGPKPGDGEIRPVAMRPVRDPVPVQAEIAIEAGSWGTRITMTCRYQRSGSYTRAYVFRLVAYGPDGASEQVSSWSAAPGDAVTLTGFTRFAMTDLERVELTRYDGTPLLSYQVP